MSGGAGMDEDTGAPGRALARARAAFRRDGIPDERTRIARLDALARAVRGAADEIGRAISADFGNRARPETVFAEIAPVGDLVRHARRHVGQWMRPERRAVGLAFRPGRAWVEHVPVGVVGIVSPWNYPLFLSAGPLVDALAAGNRAVLKPSERTPRFALLLARLIAGAFDPDTVTVVTGGIETARAFSAETWDHLVFTGSTALGREVAAAAGARLVPVTLELGGKSPAIVADDADLARAARSIATGKFFNAGQTCVAPDHVLIPRARARRFADLVVAEAGRMFPVVAENGDLTAIVSDAHRARLAALLDEAAAAGATILRAGADPASPDRRMAPVVVLDPPPGTRLMTEEIFGPILPVIGTDGLDDAIARVNDGPRPLALYAYTNDRATERRVLDGTVSGGVTINGTVLHCAQPDLPFGGIGPSGTGLCHGIDGFRRLSHARAVLRPGRFSGFETMRPPYGRLVGFGARVIARR